LATPTVPPDYALDARAVAHGFEIAPARFDSAAVLHREVARRMAERLDLVTLKPARLLDLGCGSGADLQPLRARYPDALMLGLDRSAALLAHADNKDRTKKKKNELIDIGITYKCDYQLQHRTI